MRKRTAIAVAITSLLVLMLWAGMDVTEATVVGVELKAEYAVLPNPYLPIRRLEPAY
jgi:hypothetical protein